MIIKKWNCFTSTSSFFVFIRICIIQVDKLRENNHQCINTSFTTILYNLLNILCPKNGSHEPKQFLFKVPMKRGIFIYYNLKNNI